MATEQATATVAGQRLVAPLRQRNFALYVAGQLLSQIGDGIFVVALPFLVLNQGGGSVQLGVVLACYGAARLLALPVGGTLGDKIGARSVMGWSDALRVIAVTGFVVLATIGRIPLWALIVVAVPLGILDGMFQPGAFSLIPEIVPDPSLAAANSLNITMLSGAQIAGPALGGLVVGRFKSGVGLAIDAATFLISSITIFAIRGTALDQDARHADEAVAGPQEARHAPGAVPDGGARAAGPDTGQQAGGPDAGRPVGGPDARQPVAGPDAMEADADGTALPQTWRSVLGYLRNSPLLRMSLLVTVVVNLAYDGMMEVALPSFSRSPLHSGATGFGVIMAGFGAGAVLGSLCGGAFVRLRRRGLIALFLGIAQGTAVICVPLGSMLAVATAAMFTAAALQAVLNVFYLTILQRDVPQGLLGRVMSLMLICAYAAYPLSTAVSGTVVRSVGAAPVIVVGGLCICLAFSIGFFSRIYRSL
ncbi:MAG TPA: MFS transporter [Streptosporangiaceae bacterium]|nr:MFS transporter [Streptosporangiaceae bacterium]